MPTVAELKAGASKKAPAKKKAPAAAKKSDAAEPAKPAELDITPDEQEQDAEANRAAASTLLTDLGASLADEVTVVNGLWYGAQGTRKTTALARMANLGPIIMINAEGGIKRRPLAKHGVNVDNITVWPKKDQPLTFTSLEELYWTIKATLEADPSALVGVIWDSLTEIHKALLDNAVVDAIEKARKKGIERDRFFIDRADYGTMSEQMRLLLRRFRDLPCHFAMTALMRRDTDDDGKVIYNPAITPALQNDVLGFVDVVCHTTVTEVAGEEEGQGAFTPSGKYGGKDRFDALPRKLIDPTFDRVLAYIEDDLTVETDPVMAEGKARRETVAALAGAEAQASAEGTSAEQTKGD